MKTIEQRLRRLEEKIYDISPKNIKTIKYNGGQFSRMSNSQFQSCPVECGLFPDGGLPFISKLVRINEDMVQGFWRQNVIEYAVERGNKFYVVFTFSKDRYKAILFSPYTKFRGEIVQGHIHFQSFEEGVSYLSKRMSSYLEEYTILRDFWI